MGLSIRPLRVGTLAGFEKSKFTYGFNFGEKLDAPCLVWLIEGASRKILVDSGPSGPEWAAKYHTAMKWDAEDALDRRLRSVGVDPADIDLVILTHLHWDHCFNTELFPKAKFLVQKEELKYAIAPLPVHQRAYEVDMPGIKPPWFQVFDRMVVLDGDTPVEPGIQVILLPGHTPGLQGVRVETETGVYLIASDLIPLFENWEGSPDMKHIPPGIHVSLAECFETFRKVEAITDQILPGHDPMVLDREVYGKR
ncbi:N-acyl homoserine lactonase family protein [Desulfofundulus salinus]|uniref:N-acyl homoserine lactonase family protein n=1 Tax=Desulfofundulus salinus TaxID=2419843 RepID=A0A494WSL7_9FIRM|nr:N-acyl homoserine lactonase family protein [Desulfofundulus salinum]RKO65861.1 N-acyl homoserine lactonase family protein [Desulfofundulus salinum]